MSSENEQSMDSIVLSLQNATSSMFERDTLLKLVFVEGGDHDKGHKEDGLLMARIQVVHWG